MLTGRFKNARFGRPPNLHTCISVVEVCRFEQCLGWIFSPTYIFSLVCFRAFRDAPHSRLWCGDTKVCLKGSLKMLDLAVPQIYTRVFRLWKSVALDNAWDGDSRPVIFFSLACFRAFRDAPHSRFWCRDLKLCLLDFLKMLDLAFSQIYTRVFHLWKCNAVDNAWIKDSRPFISFFHPPVFARFAMRHTRVFGVGNPNFAYEAL